MTDQDNSPDTGDTASTSPRDGAIDPGTVPCQYTNRDTARDGDHVLSSAVEVWQEYEQRYDSDRGVMLLGPSRTTDNAEAITHYQCSCGAFFTDQIEATKHVLRAAGETVSNSTSPQTQR